MAARMINGRRFSSLSVVINREVEMVVPNSGPGFDPRSVPDPTVHQNIYDPHSRGLFLNSQFMNEIRYEMAALKFA